MTCPTFERDYPVAGACCLRDSGQRRVPSRDNFDLLFSRDTDAVPKTEGRWQLSKEIYN